MKRGDYAKDTEDSANLNQSVADLPHVGLPADELLKMAGRERARILTWPGEITGNDNEGLLVKWEYLDCTIDLHYRLGRYRVKSITEKEHAHDNNT